MKTILLTLAYAALFLLVLPLWALWQGVQWLGNRAFDWLERQEDVV